MSRFRYSSRKYQVSYQKDERFGWYVFLVSQDGVGHNGDKPPIRYTNEFMLTEVRQAGDHDIAERDVVPFYGIYTHQRDKFSSTYWPTHTNTALARPQVLENVLPVSRDSLPTRPTASTPTATRRDRLLSRLQRLSSGVGWTMLPFQVDGGEYTVRYQQQVETAGVLTPQRFQAALSLETAYTLRRDIRTFFRLYTNRTSSLMLGGVAYRYRITGRKRPLSWMVESSVWYGESKVRVGGTTLSTPIHIGRLYTTNVHTSLREVAYGTMASVGMQYRVRARITLEARTSLLIFFQRRYDIIFSDTPKLNAMGRRHYAILPLTHPDIQLSSGALDVRTPMHMRHAPSVEICIRIGSIGN